MKKIFVKTIALFVPLCLCSCGGGSDDEIIVPEDPKANLSINTTIQTRTVVTSFASGDKMNVFVKTGSSVGSSDYKSGVSAAYNGSAWTLSSVVELQNDAYVFAAYPYSASGDAQSMSVSVSPQTDYLYSGTGVKVSGSSPVASLTMKHALPMIAFNIVKGSYTGEGKLTGIEVSGETLYKTGSMNVANGSITGKDKGNYSITASKVVAKDGWTEDFPQMFCLPFESDGSKITVTLKIDGKEMKAMLPKQSVTGGMKYLFRMALAEDGVIVLANQTEIISLNKNTDQMTGGDVNDLSILYVGSKAVLPTLSGNGTISGTVDWGDGSQESYTASMIHAYGKEGEYRVKVQTFGATSFEFKDLEAIEEIDLSQF